MPSKQARAVAQRSALQFRLLGPLEVLREGTPVGMGGPRPRALLALLLLDLGRVVSIDRIVDGIWGDRPPETAGHAVEVHVSQLRKALQPARRANGEPEILVTQSPGYVLDAAVDQVDAYRFRGLVEQGRAALIGDDPEAAAAILGDALALWRGPALQDFAYHPFAQTEIARLHELRLSSLESRIEADLRRGRHVDVVAELESLVEAEPLHERFRAQLMLALYRSGRQADALAAYRKAREALVEGLGIEPGEELRRLEGEILRQDVSLALGPVAEPKIEIRRTATIVCAAAEPSDVDPELEHRALERYAELLETVFARHGASVERSAGGLVTASFGVPLAHEDDHLRAARSAVEARGAVSALNDRLAREGIRLGSRIGLEAGEVVSRGESVSGNPVRSAARLRDSAAHGEILIGEVVAGLLGGDVRLEGAGEALRLVELPADQPAPPTQLDGPLFGRKRELAALRGARARARSGATIEAVTILGPAGIGKSRLAHELTSRSRRYSTLVGRCPSYGEGVTYMPLQEIVVQAVGSGRPEAIAAILGESRGNLIAARTLAAVVGENGNTTPSRQEVAWAFRRLCETLAARRPLVLVLDDLHWAEPELLDLVEDLVDRGAGPVLVVCVARDELLEERPTFLAQRARATQVRVDALPGEAAQALLDGISGGALTREEHAGILATAEGNPLYLEQLTAHAAEAGFQPGRPPPASIQALLAARLDRLGPGERAVLERAAVVGREFRRSAVVELLEPAAAARAGEHLRRLEERGFVQPARDETLQFRHALVQDAVLRAAPKLLRAGVHERYADLLTEDGDAIAEIVGYHLEQAHLLRTDVGLVDRLTRKLGEDASQALVAAAARADRQDDWRAATRLLERSLAVLPVDDPARLGLELRRATMQKFAGDTEFAIDELDRVATRAEALGNRSIELRARVEQVWPRVLQGRMSAEEALAVVERGVSVFDALGDHEAAVRAWFTSAVMNIDLRLRLEEGAAALARVDEHQARGGNSRLTLGAVLRLNSTIEGPRPLREGATLSEDLLAEVDGHLAVTAAILRSRARLEGMQGRFDDGRASVDTSWSIVTELGYDQVPDWIAGNAAVAGEIELLAGIPDAAEELLRPAIAIQRERGATLWLSSLLSDLSAAVLEQGRPQEALELAGEAMEHSQPVDVRCESHWRRARARALADLGARAEAEPLAREATALMAATDAVDEQGRALLDLARVLRSADQRNEARTIARDALERFERKGCVPMSELAEALIGRRMPARRA